MGWCLLCVSLLVSAFIGAFQDATALTISVYNTTSTPVQIVRDPVDDEVWFNVHLYILVDAGAPEVVVQGGAFLRWSDEERWEPAPAPLYDEHQVDPVTAGTRTRGYNIAFGQSLGVTSLPPSRQVQFRIWAITGQGEGAEVHTTVPVVDVALGGIPFTDKLELRLFKAVAFASIAEQDGIHVHLVINVFPPQSPSHPDHQLFADLEVADGEWVDAGAPSRFEHTYDEAERPRKVRSRYNLSWRLAPGMTTALGKVCDPRGTASSLRIRVHAASFTGTVGDIVLPPLAVDCIAASLGPGSADSKEAIVL